MKSLLSHASDVLVTTLKILPTRWSREARGASTSAIKQQVDASSHGEAACTRSW